MFGLSKDGSLMKENSPGDTPFQAIVCMSSKIVTLIDVGGSYQHKDTLMRALSGMNPHFALLCFSPGTEDMIATKA